MGVAGAGMGVAGAGAGVWWWWQGAARCGLLMQTADTLDTGAGHQPLPPAPSTLISTDTTLSRAGQVLLLPSVCKEG